jgi:hypothetical protein
MKVYWLSVLPLAGALVVALLRQRRVPMLVAVLATLLGYLRLCSALPLGQGEAFLKQSWMLDAGAQHLLMLACWATAILLAIAAADPKAGGVHAPLLVSLGLLSAAVLLRSWLLAVLLLPAALIVPILATLPTDRSAPRGAAYFLAWATAPVPFLLGIPWLLDQLAVHPQEVAVVTWSAWLLLPAWILWLNLFPFNGATPLWAAGGEPLGPAFLWAVKDGVVIYLLLGLWREMPALQTEGVLSTLRTLGLLTALFSGIWAVIQPHLSGVLGCAAMAALGLIVQGLATGSADSLGAALFVLLSRSAAILMATSALAALHGSSAGSAQENRKRFPWEGLLLWLISTAGVVALLRLPMMDNSGAGQSLLAILQALPGEPRLGQAWRISSVGILIGLAHTSWRLWRGRVRNSVGRIRPVPFLLALGLLLFCLYLVLAPQVVQGLVSSLMLF